jgi:SAM-dependent methyltransferase
MKKSDFELPALGEMLQRYYARFLDEHGPTARGVDWNSPESQRLRFSQLLRVHQGEGPFSVNDYGCGYGALVDYLRSRGDTFTYTGYDLVPRLLESGRQLFGDLDGCAFVDREEELQPADYTVASGVFNVNLASDYDTWTSHVVETLHRLRHASTKAFGFNSLTTYSDPEYMRSHLYYADPCFLFDYCKRTFSREVALLHDYGLYEFTIIVRLREDE